MSDSQKNGYVVLQRFMIDGLGLTGDELIVYAIIYGFCQDGRSSCRCSRSYFAYWLGKSKTTVNRIIDTLVAKGYVVRSHEIVDGQTMPRRECRKLCFARWKGGYAHVPPVRRRTRDTPTGTYNGYRYRDRYGIR